MDIVQSVFGVPIRLTDERWVHIVRRHPDLSNDRSAVLDVVEAPIFVRRARLGTLMAAKQLGDLWLVVVYRETSTSDGFILTAYQARYLREEEVVWRN